MKSSDSLNKFHAIRHTVSSEKNSHDLRDFNIIVKKKEVVRDALSISDIVQCNKVPVLKHIANARLIQDNQSFLNSTSVSLDGNDKGRSITKSASSADISHRNKFTIKKDELNSSKSNNASKKKNDSEDNKLTLALEHMNNSRIILDSSRLMFEAAVLFDDMQSYDRASTCYVKSTKRVNADSIVDTYDLPHDAVYQRKVERMSRFRLDAFLEARNTLRSELIIAENNRQRMRARASFCQLVRIYLLTHLYNLDLAHQYLTQAFRSCASDEEHVELLHYFHHLITVYAAENKTEMTMNQQLIRGCAGPIAEAHINVLHDLESLNDRDIDILQWLGFRYAEKCDFEASKSYFKKVRDYTAPHLNMKDTLELWRRSKPKMDVDDTLRRHRVSAAATEEAGKVTEGEKGEETEEMNEIRASIRQNVCKDNVGGYTSLDIPDAQTQQEMTDFAWFRGKHAQSDTLLYTVPKQGWNTVDV